MLEHIGWIGNACFFARWIVQWIDIERSGSNRATKPFWVLSIAGTLVLGAYAARHGAWVLVAGFFVNGAIYVRNLHIVLRPDPARRSTVGRISAAAALAGVIFVAASVNEDWNVCATSRLWTACAILGQSLWSGRFVLQWWLSERTGDSHFSTAFWNMSLAGNVLLLAYAIHLWDAVLTVGLLPGPLVHIRNLRIARAQSGRRGSSAEESSARLPVSLAAR